MAVTGSANIFVKTFQGFWQVLTGKINPGGSDGATGVGRARKRRRDPVR